MSKEIAALADAVSSLRQRFSVAHAIGGDAVWNAKGAGAASQILMDAEKVIRQCAIKSKSCYRAVSPNGSAQKWRRSELMALRDAVYQVKGWGKRGVDGVTIICDTHVAQNYLDEVLAAGWTFEVTKVAT